ncbi:hypothetical protein KVJ76_01060 [Helicobacter pylori]|nr:hypothetical protein KVJ76_01060 [Helicobacter pylori]
MRHEHETATSFKQLQSITQAIMLKKGAPKNATNQESDRTQETHNANAKANAQEQAQKTSAQTSENANASEPTQKSALKHKAKAQAKTNALKPTKRAFSERQITTIRDNSQASAKQGDNANAFKSDEENTRGQQ